jgi:hypothetical protein
MVLVIGAHAALQAEMEYPSYSALLYTKDRARHCAWFFYCVLSERLRICLIAIRMKFLNFSYHVANIDPNPNTLSGDISLTSVTVSGRSINDANPELSPPSVSVSGWCTRENTHGVFNLSEPIRRLYIYVFSADTPVRCGHFHQSTLFRRICQSDA